VVFTVRHKEFMFNAEEFGGRARQSFELRASKSERYAAVYFPAAGAGWVQVADPDSPKDPPLVAPLGKVQEWGFTFKPHRQYSMIVALDKPGRIVFPSDNFRVIGFRHRQIVGATLGVKELLVPGDSSAAVAGFTDNTIGTAQVSVAAISVDYAHASDRVINGDACVAPAPGYPCALDKAGMFSAHWGASGGPGRDTVGRAYTSPPTGSFITGDYEVLDGAPFQSARLIAFGLRYDQ